MMIGCCSIVGDGRGGPEREAAENTIFGVTGEFGGYLRRKHTRVRRDTVETGLGRAASEGGEIYYS